MYIMIFKDIRILTYDIRTLHLFCGETFTVFVDCIITEKCFSMNIYYQVYVTVWAITGLVRTIN